MSIYELCGNLTVERPLESGVRVVHAMKEDPLAFHNRDFQHLAGRSLALGVLSVCLTMSFILLFLPFSFLFSNPFLSCFISYFFRVAKQLYPCTALPSAVPSGNQWSVVRPRWARVKPRFGSTVRRKKPCYFSLIVFPVTTIDFPLFCDSAQKAFYQ